MNEGKNNPRTPGVVLRQSEADRVVAGHPWVFERGIQRVEGELEDGAVVAVKDSRQRFLGVGFFNGRSRIRLRMVSHRNVAVDQAFFEERFREALAHRARWLPEARSFRLVNAESDFLSGLIVDKYEDVLVLQISSLGMEQRKADILAALEAVLQPRAIVERNDIPSRRFEGLAETRGVLRGEWAADQVAFVLNGLTFEADPLTGQKTGFYLDQQVNYRLVAEMVAHYPQATVLDCFSSTGAFALHAARTGAARVLCLDQSAEALTTAGRLAERNGLADRFQFETVNVFDWLKARSATPEGETAPELFDVVILDPPSFTRTRSALPDALRGYKEIHLRALRLLKPGGLLTTFCCSHHVDARTFQDVILSAAFDVRRVLRRVATFTQSPDHPILPSVPETEYLKGYAFEVVR